MLPLFIDVVAAENLLPSERCLDDCMTLAHAYAQLGIPAEVRAVQLALTNVLRLSRGFRPAPRRPDDRRHVRRPTGSRSRRED
ncbi:hypothetical protein GBF35_50580 [Nonomuraea phyllanthi]|uniref:hypothetical protein n=1 Tax=Nonomuraea phyllanthi TaxID=2219224 RepID=UPI0012937F32|nr:hypothetical protein [Nonomuraea phyllanthi]QFY13721.1 hypothetical protein GBF35_50580 [Nonomuraea phyllanthi]